eukprot:scaffold5206_cov80-Skeletonema_marinoi.AAC.1
MGKGIIAPHCLRHNLSLPFSREVNGMGERRSTLDRRPRSHGLRTHNHTQICVYTDADPGRFENLQQRLEAPKRCPSTTMGPKLFVWGSSRVDTTWLCWDIGGYDTR